MARLIVLALVIALASGAVVWSAWRARWIAGSLIVSGGVTLLLAAARQIVGAEPVAYGIALAASLFLAAAMLVMGMVAAGARGLAREDR